VHIPQTPRVIRGDRHLAQIGFIEAAVGRMNYIVHVVLTEVRPSHGIP